MNTTSIPFFLSLIFTLLVAECSTLYAQDIVTLIQGYQSLPLSNECRGEIFRVIGNQDQRADFCRVVKITTYANRDGVMNNIENCYSAYREDQIDYNFRNPSIHNTPYAHAPEGRNSDYVVDHWTARVILHRVNLQTRNCGCELIFEQGINDFPIPCSD